MNTDSTFYHKSAADGLRAARQGRQHRKDLLDSPRYRATIKALKARLRGKQGDE